MLWDQFSLADQVLQGAAAGWQNPADALKAATVVENSVAKEGKNSVIRVHGSKQAHNFEKLRSAVSLS